MVPGELSTGNYILSKPGELYFVYFTSPTAITLKLPGSRPYKIDGIDTWNMTISSLGSASPGKFSFTPPKTNYVLRLSLYGPGEKVRPEAKASAGPTEGIAPLKVQFSTPTKLSCQWEFGDGTSSSKRNPTHIYKEPGLYTAMLTVTDKTGLSAGTALSIAVDRSIDSPIVRVGFKDGESLGVQISPGIVLSEDRTYNFRDGEPWKWIAVGNKPIKALEGLRSFTIMGWANPSSLKIGSGGNRIAFNLNYNHSGFDLVCLKDGRLRLAVNEWPDRIKNDSSPKKLRISQWTFFAVTYDATKSKNNVHWYFGNAVTAAELERSTTYSLWIAPYTAAQLDRTTTYNRGPTGKGSGTLTVGNYNESIQRRHGKDRQFRGKLHGIQVFGSRIGPRGALPLNVVREHQQKSKPQL
jgi:PKD repeat protein